MNADELRSAAIASGTQPRALCFAIAILLPALEAAFEHGSGWRFWLRWGMRHLISVMEDVQRTTCLDAGGGE